MVVVGAAGLSYQVSQTAPFFAAPDTVKAAARADIMHDFAALNLKIRQFEDKQSKHNFKIVDDQIIAQEVSDVTYNEELGQVSHARKALAKLARDLEGWNKKLNDSLMAEQTQIPDSAATQVVTPQGVNVPILLYHYTPPNFATQLQYLADHHYTGITLDQLVNALTGGGALPAKPVIITFDDGYSDQMKAFALLKQYRMPATYYIINGGPASNWCIGAGRTNSTCGDSYLSWDQVRELDASGLITIGSHTVDHANLASLPPDKQRMEIFDGKAQLEGQLGHKVHHFCYPYGSYNATTIALVREAGFTTATTTLPGTYQNASNLLTLYRVRNTLTLP